MKVKDLKSGQGKIDIELEIVSKGEIRNFDTPRASGRVCNAAGNKRL